MKFWPVRVVGVSALLVSLLWTTAAEARDVFLTIGGGYSPHGNQISLEQNVLFFKRLLAQRNLSAAPHDVLFSDGDSPDRDVQFLDPDSVPRANRLMAQLFDHEDELGISYRNHQLDNVRAGSSPEELERWFAEVGSRLQPGDRLFIYATAHGGESTDRRNPENSKLYMWNDEEVTVREVSGLLATLPQGVQVALVMVQCYSGGFANLIYENGDPNRGLVDRDITGFFATVHDRVAAGCTPDIEAEDYQEYSTLFWAALGGQTRLGQAIEKPDYNGDGEISLEEAHQYVILHSTTIDIPVRTSDAFLRKYSGMASEFGGELVDTASYESLLAAASPSERILLEGLSQQLGLEGNNRVSAAQRIANSSGRQQASINRRERRSLQQLGGVRSQIVADLEQQWPEIANPYNPQTIELLTTRSDEFLQAVQSHELYDRFVELHDAAENVTSTLLDADRRVAKAMRFVRISENVALAANLPVLADTAIVERYQRILALERSGL